METETKRNEMWTFKGFIKIRRGLRRIRREIVEDGNSFHSTPMEQH